MIEILDFYDEWCSPCKALQPILHEVIKKYDNVVLTPVRTSEKPEMASQYNVRGIPCLIFKKNDEIVGRLDGLVTEDQIRELLEEIQE